MALIALAADKGAPGVTTAAVALGAVWPRPVLVAECDQAGGDLVYRLPAESGDGRDAMLNPTRGLISLAATARRGLRPAQIAEHSQRLAGGLDVLVGLSTAEQAQGMTWLWGPLGRAFAGLSPVDVLADCGRLGAGTPLLDLMRSADLVVLFTRASLDHVAHLRERVTALAGELRDVPPIGIIMVAEPRDFRSSIGELERIVAGARLPATVLGGLAHDAKGAEMLRGHWGGRLDRSLLIRSAREVAGRLAAHTAVRAPAPQPPSMEPPSMEPPPNAAPEPPRNGLPIAIPEPAAPGLISADPAGLAPPVPARSMAPAPSIPPGAISATPPHGVPQPERRR